jgi:ketosteroid isomerase-like protein
MPMPSTDAVEVVNRYLAAIASRDFDSARSYLADRGFRYTSPIATLDDADAFVASLLGVGAILQRVEAPHVFVRDGDVCHVLDVTVAMAGYETQRVVHLAHVAGGRITRIEVIFDATNYHRMIGAEDSPATG